MVVAGTVLGKQPFIRNYEIPGIDGAPVVCDIYHPPSDGLRPACVFVHGGGFTGGDKDQFLGAASWLALCTGAVAVTVQYRTAGRAAYPAPIIDCLSVFQWIWNNRRELKVEPSRVFAAGGSPGANIAAMAMMADDEFLNRYLPGAGKLFRPAAGIFLNGIYDLVEFYEKNPQEQDNINAYLDRVEFEEELWREASPVNHMRSGLRVLMLHGSEDSVVSPTQCEEMKRRLEANGSSADIKIFKGQQHAWFNEQENLYEVLAEIKAFMENSGNEVSSHGA